MLGGDLNLPSVNWKDGITQEQPQYGVSLNAKGVGIADDYGLTQIVETPTRKSSILDIILCTYPDLMSDVAVVEGISDHEAVTAKINFKAKLNIKKPRKVLLF